MSDLTSHVEIDIEQLLSEEPSIASAMFRVSMKIPSTGEIREVERDTVESALRTLGRTIDEDFGIVRNAGN